MPYIRTVLAEETYLADGTRLTLICYQAMFYDSPFYGIPILVISSEGGVGAYETSIYRLTDHGISKIFCSPDYENDDYFDTQFTLHLSEGYIHTVQNNNICFYTSLFLSFYACGRRRRWHL